MRKTAIALAILACGIAGVAHARPDTRDMYCDEAKDLVRQYGKITVSTSDTKYVRAVHNAGGCFRNQVTRPLRAPTIDEPLCHIGYWCEDRLPPRG